MPEIHTTISLSNKKTLLEYGKGSLKTGIENLIAFAESQKVKVEIVTVLEI